MFPEIKILKKSRLTNKMNSLTDGKESTPKRQICDENILKSTVSLWVCNCTASTLLSAGVLYHSWFCSFFFFFFCHFNLPSLHLSPRVAHPTWCMQVCAPMHGNEEARAELGLSSLPFPSYSLERVTLTDSQLWKPQQRQTFPLPLSPWLPWDRVAGQAKSPHDLPVSAAQGWAIGEPAVPDFSQSCWKFTFRSTRIENKCPCPRKHLPSPFSLL